MTGSAYNKTHGRCVVWIIHITVLKLYSYGPFDEFE